LPDLRHHFELINRAVCLGADIRTHIDTVAEVDDADDLPRARSFAQDLIQ
jgi:hypothetical protein